MPVQASRTGRGGPGAAPPPFRAGGTAAGFAAALGILLILAGTPGAARADSGQLLVQATVLSKSVCRFDTRTSTLGFGALDPAGSGNATATTSVPFVCRGSAPVAMFAFSGDDGLHPAGPGARRMRHATDAASFLPYSLAVSPSVGFVAKNVHTTVTISGMVYATDYRVARAGSYADTVILTLLP